MKILLINQPTENRGDESAHRSLIVSLIAAYPKAHISCVFVGEKTKSVRQMQVKSRAVKYICIPLNRGSSRIPDLAFNLYLRRLVAFIHPAYRRLKRLIGSADYIINAPGGICMGRFQSWRHIFYLMIARDLRKPIAYYSRSFGPFSEATRKDRLFKRYSQLLLNYFDFISIRDLKTMNIADQMGMRYIKSIDTAFLNVPNVKIPFEVSATIDSKAFVVFVPNTLIWHIDYRTADASRIKSFYLKMIDILFVKYPDIKVVMLPQLFNIGDNGDLHYFEYLRRQSPHKDNIVVLPEIYGSDIQQAIIAKSKLVVGARYHSIVFAINNRVPFIALSYEHKILGLLGLLKMQPRALKLGSFCNLEFDEKETLVQFEELLNCQFYIGTATQQANVLASECFQKLVKRINDVCLEI